MAASGPATVRGTATPEGKETLALRSTARGSFSLPKGAAAQPDVPGDADEESEGGEAGGVVTLLFVFKLIASAFPSVHPGSRPAPEAPGAPWRSSGAAQDAPGGPAALPDPGVGGF